MKILVDEFIPYAYEIFKDTGNVVKIHSDQLFGREILDTHCLLVRSITKINKGSLKDRKLIKFIGSATSGIDHIDTNWLKELDITFSAAPGCNSIAVAEYVFSSLLFLAERNNFQLKDRTIGIVGFGNIGSYLNKILQVWGITTLLCDPPKSDDGHKDKRNFFYPLSELISKVDIITFHIPLINEGKYKTFHMMNKEYLLSLKPNTILVNSSRGSVINTKDLIDVLEIRKDIKVVMDVWEGEPEISANLLNQVTIATAHIAGFTIEAKIRATIKLYAEWCKLIKKTKKIKINKFLPNKIFNNIFLNGNITQSKLNKLVNLIYNIYTDDSLLRNAIITQSCSFDNLRNHYRARSEWFSLKISCNNYETFDVLKKIGFNAIFKPNF
ncbi:4-phosphoerythronate dehydrogenase [Pantoea sp. SoEX]|uniref:4-phosphoerythronate dehydrogenase n=1 Tax=Pantoea sp. SoEX TaxID=2576763 RepID=UPI001359EBA6|nr:4-phosphoerythronate dehydrogenase [Pantoea sp. SoEX]MXP50864.1 4-phosphoerythronate dehydrogenase [Pantoea sp. SoEX]